MIDQIPPELEIRGVRDGSANAGVLKPEIISQDLNYQSGSLGSSADWKPSGSTYIFREICNDVRWRTVYL